MKLYTRGGDKGETSLIGGTRTGKHSARVTAYGTLDELNALVGLAIATLSHQKVKQELIHIQHTIFDCGTDLATPEPVTEPLINSDHVTWLEDKIDFYSDQTPKLKNFILPGGSLDASYLHVARTVARRAEREISRLMETEEINQYAASYVNRLSDYLFAIARFVNFEGQVEEQAYITKK